MSRDVVLEAARGLRSAYEAVEWATTPLGPMASWSPALRNAVHLALNTRFPVTLLWGPEFVLVYNEAYVRLIADKHPGALGARAEDVFPEAWDVIGPMMRDVLAGRGATWVEDASVPLVRNGVLREAYFTFSYSPVRGEDGAIEGVLDIAAETTRQVVDRRRLLLLGRLREVLAVLDRAEEVPNRVVAVLREDPDDLPDVRLEWTAAGDVPHAPSTAAGVRVEETREGRVARMPIGGAHGERQPVLVVRLSERLPLGADYLGFLRLIASSIAQAVDRIDAHEEERGIVEALQRTMLSRPLQPDGLAVAVRYLPAAEVAQVGGDWYDAFMGPDGALRLVVGDVTGHDERAAAAMAQVRNLLRGISYVLPRPPAGILAALDESMLGLHVDVYATAILARVEEDAARGGQILRWANAGHPPPVLLAPDGRTRLLDTPPEVLLGLGAGKRTDHTVALEPGAAVVFYTDGLVERRRVPLQERLEWLAELLEGRQALSAEALCDHVLDRLDAGVEDDIALLVVRFDATP